MLNSIRLLRGIAALLVVVYHVCEYLKTHGYPELADAFPFGAIGVDLFFAVSGFVMLHAMESKKFDAGFSSGFDFFVRRIIRVAPIYWIGTSALYGIYVAMPHKFKMFSASAEQYWRSMLFLPSVGEGSTIRPLLTQGWTLYHEMYFYLVLAMAIVVLGRRWVGGVVAAAIALTLLVVQTSIGDAPVPWLELLASPMNIEFLLGVAVYTLFRSGGARSSLIGLGALAVLVGFWMSADFSHVRNWARVSSWGLLSFGVFLIAIQFEQEISKFFHLLSKYLGDPSYSLYIFHGLAFSAVDLLLRRLPIQFDSISMMVLLCSGAILVGNVMYRFVEKPMTSRMNAWWSTVSRRWLVSEPTRMR